MRGAGADRRAGRDRRARRRRDRQHRPGPPRAAGHRRGDRRGQGRADRRRCRRAGRRSFPPASRCSTPHLARRRDAPSPSDRTATCASSSADEDRVTIDAGGERIALEVPFTQAHLRAEPAGRGGRGARGRRHAAGPRRAGADAPAAGSAYVAERRNGHRRLLQRQPDVDARRPRRPCGHRRRAPTAARRVAVLGDMLELGPEEREFHAPARRAGERRRRRPAGHRRAAGGGDRRALRAARPISVADAARGRGRRARAARPRRRGAGQGLARRRARARSAGARRAGKTARDAARPRDGS